MGSCLLSLQTSQNERVVAFAKLLLTAESFGCGPAGKANNGERWEHSIFVDSRSGGS